MYRDRLVPLSRWAQKKREFHEKLKKRDAAEEELVVALIGIAAQYIQTSDLIDFSTEVRSFLDNRTRKDIPLSGGIK